jgi:integrase
VENHLALICSQTGKLVWRRGWKINLAQTPPKLENYHGARHIHPKLIELGFIMYYQNMKESGHPRLWMNLSYIHLHGYTNTFGKWYQRYNRDYVTDDPKKVFHSMRHTVTDTLKQAGVIESVIAELVGHSNGGSMTMGRYGKRYQPKVLLEALKKLDYAIVATKG